MGSGSSKDAVAGAGNESAATSSRCRGGGAKFLFSCSSSSCFRITSFDEQKVEENGRSKHTTCASVTENKPSGTIEKCCDNINVAHQRKIPPLPSSDDDDQSDVDHDDNLQSDSGAGSSSIAAAAISSSRNNSGRLLSRFNFIPEGINFRLNRAVSLGSSQAHSVFSNSLSGPRNDVVDHDLVDGDSTLDNSNNNNCSTNVENNSGSGITRTNAGIEATINHFSNRIPLEPSSTRMRHSHRRYGQQEPLEGSVRFSRTLSVGRLRDRVLRRTSVSEGLYAPTFSGDRSLVHDGEGSGRRVLAGGRRATSSSSRSNPTITDSPTVPQSRFGSSISFNDEPSGSRDLLEHRSAFVERRRRIRSQVRALQRLGSRFESLSGHDRSCILSGQHRTGSCTCRTSNRSSNPDDDTTTRASISRIVMLAEALFEVLDEIHQQSVVLSSRPSFSSIGSVPAPKEVVENIPIKIYNRPSKTLEDAAQCYICLVEYEEGDCVRVLPCNHEFHRTCVDKWLKEIHRVCPLCRGDVCLSEASDKQKVN